MSALVVYCCISAFSKFWDVTWMSSVAVSYSNLRASLLRLLLHLPTYPQFLCVAQFVLVAHSVLMKRMLLEAPSVSFLDCRVRVLGRFSEVN